MGSHADKSIFSNSALRYCHQNCTIQILRFSKSFALKQKVTKKLRFIRRLCVGNLIIAIHWSWVSQWEIFFYSTSFITKFEAVKTGSGVEFCVWPLWNARVISVGYTAVKIIKIDSSTTQTKWLLRLLKVLRLNSMPWNLDRSKNNNIVFVSMPETIL